MTLTRGSGGGLHTRIDNKGGCSAANIGLRGKMHLRWKFTYLRSLTCRSVGLSVGSIDRLVGWLVGWLAGTS